MKRTLQIVAALLLISLAVALVLGIVFLHSWGWRIEVLLKVFGDPVWVTLDAGRPAVWLLLLVPGLLLAAAGSLFRRRPTQ
jgi:hypothetical protein